MRYSVLASSSSANVTFLEAGGVRLLIDVGLRCRTLETRLKEIGIEPDSLDGILITHEHTDHVQGLSVFTKKHPMPVFVNYNTAAVIERQCRLAQATIPEFTFFETDIPFALSTLTITPLAIPHDTAEPVGFLIHDGTHQLGYFTDLGYVPERIRMSLPNCDALILESNYDPQMLQQSNRTFQLISRIRGRSGHLANEDACETVASCIGETLKCLTLAHLSRDCNQPHLAEAMMRATLNQIQRTDVVLTIAKPDMATPFITLT